jgi:hypothetical protein
MNEPHRQELELNLTHFREEAQLLLNVATDALAYVRLHDLQGTCTTIGLTSNHLSALLSQRDWLLEMFRRQGITPQTSLTG